MAEMSFKQAKDLAVQMELSEVSLKKASIQIEKASKNLEKSLIKQEQILHIVPKTDTKLNNMKLVVALNIGFISGLLVSKYLF